MVSDVVTIFQKMRGERVPQAVTDHRFVDTQLAHRLFYRSLYSRLVQMMPSLDPAPRIHSQARCGEEILPAELACGIREVSLQRVGQPDLTAAGSEVLAVMRRTHSI